MAISCYSVTNLEIISETHSRKHPMLSFFMIDLQRSHYSAKLTIPVLVDCRDARLVASSGRGRHFTDPDARAVRPYPEYHYINFKAMAEWLRKGVACQRIKRTGKRRVCHNGPSGSSLEGFGLGHVLQYAPIDLTLKLLPSEPF